MSQDPLDQLGPAKHTGDPPDSTEPLEFDDEMNDVTVRIPVVRTSMSRRQTTPTLRVVAGRDMLKFITLPPGTDVVIGRDEHCDMRLGDLTVSKRHARVTADENGTITLFDLGSTNGTTVNTVPVMQQVLRAGDHVELGGVSLRLDNLSNQELGHLRRVIRRMESANRDPLTGLLTRSYLDDELSQLAYRCERADLPFACAFVDIDKFKPINDRYGHQVGDEVLRIIARLLMLGVRDSDPCVRYGGDEVLLFLPGNNESVAAEIAERIRRCIAGHDWERTAAGLRVTASFGVAERHRGEPLKQWLHRADQALYDAKRSGQNRVERASSRYG